VVEEREGLTHASELRFVATGGGREVALRSGDHVASAIDADEPHLGAPSAHFFEV
jgi:hypothetical protein